MNKTCLKCGAASEVELTAFTACPKCGAVYSKVEQAEEARRAAEVARAAKPATVPQQPTQARPEPEPLSAQDVMFAKLNAPPKKRALKFHRFYTQELAVLLFWAAFIAVIVVVSIAIVSAPKSAPFLLGCAFVGLLFLRVVLETMAVLFQIHARLEELCKAKRKSK